MGPVNSVRRKAGPLGVPQALRVGRAAGAVHGGVLVLGGSAESGVALGIIVLLLDRLATRGVLDARHDDEARRVAANRDEDLVVARMGGDALDAGDGLAGRRAGARRTRRRQV